MCQVLFPVQECVYRVLASDLEVLILAFYGVDVQEGKSLPVCFRLNQFESDLIEIYLGAPSWTRTAAGEVTNWIENKGNRQLMTSIDPVYFLEELAYFGFMPTGKYIVLVDYPEWTDEDRATAVFM